MIDPRQSPVAMLPILNAVAGHMIAKAAPLRVINVEDTEQMVCEAAGHCGLDAEAMDLAAHHELMEAGSFFKDTEQLANRVGTLQHRASCMPNLYIFLNTLEATIAEAV